ncbi:fluoride efflux transporter CrcB [Halobacteriales archaeon QS_4_69_34]|nr:MAG: fluoride efflux transporter CrcB [Halobacteriales archaeon QS_4_69_34]
MVDPAHLVGTGGAIGALLRYWVGKRVAGRDVPLATPLVNVVGSFVLGLLVFAGVGGDTLLFVGTGACGSFTTFSSFSYETVRLWESGEPVRATAYAGGTLAASLAAVGTAWLLAGPV